jgi:hypothetical protein
VVFLEEDYENMYDRQLEEAKILLKTFIQKPTIGMAISEYKKDKALRDAVIVT